VLFEHQPGQCRIEKLIFDLTLFLACNPQCAKQDQAPPALGKALIGKRCDDAFEINIAGTTREYQILSVC